MERLKSGSDSSASHSSKHSRMTLASKIKVKKQEDCRRRLRLSGNQRDELADDLPHHDLLQQGIVGRPLAVADPPPHQRPQFIR